MMLLRCYIGMLCMDNVTTVLWYGYFISGSLEFILFHNLRNSWLFEQTMLDLGGFLTDFQILAGDL